MNSIGLANTLSQDKGFHGAFDHLIDKTSRLPTLPRSLKNLQNLKRKKKTFSCMNHLLNLWIHTNHPLIKIRMVPHQNIRIPRSGNENCIHPTPDWGQKNLAHLQSNEECKGKNNGCESAAGVVGRGGELEVEESEQGTEVGDEGGAHG